MNIIGEPEGKDIILIDDIIDTGGTFTNAVKALKDAGARKVYGACTHPVLSGNAIERLEDSPLEYLLTTDTIPLARESKKIKVKSVAKVFAEAIRRTNLDKSISSLFDDEK
jgi:ribose-phosphate pyrophosphokinase